MACPVSQGCRFPEVNHVALPGGVSAHRSDPRKYLFAFPHFGAITRALFTPDTSIRTPNAQSFGRALPCPLRTRSVRVLGAAIPGVRLMTKTPPRTPNPHPARAVGMDFGTTNSVLAFADAANDVHVVETEGATNFPSILCFYIEEDRPGREVLVGKAGPDAIAAYREMREDCRLIQSIKSYLANPTVSETQIFGRRYKIEDIASVLIRGLRRSGETQHGALGDHITSGRPVRFTGHKADENLAVTRLSAAYAQAGFDQVAFAFEPLAAAYHHVRNLTTSEVCLVADFGGGTSDFSLVRFTPDTDGVHTEALGHTGIGIAGDQLDYRIVEHVVAPVLGQNTYYESFGKRLPMPMGVYRQFQRWSDLSLLKGGPTLKNLRDIHKTAEDPDAIAQLIYIIDNELGFELFQSVGRAKIALSTEDSSAFSFHAGPVAIDATLSRADFESWIAPDIAAIEDTMLAAFAESNLRPNQVAHVFMTGGTSFVPAINRIFEKHFGADKITRGDEFVSVGAGLALLAQESRSHRP